MDLSLKVLAKKHGIVLMANEEIISRAFENVLASYDTTEAIKHDFDELVDKIEVEAYRLYLEEEQRFGAKVLEFFMRESASGKTTISVDQAALILGEHFKELKEFFKSLGQSRSSRAGKAFETIHNRLFKTLGYPFAEQPIINGKPDFIMPSVERYNENPRDCIVFTAKRTLRERWRQVVTEGTKGSAFYLATIDKTMSDTQLRAMHELRVNLVCPKRIKEAHYSRVENVLSFEQFFLDVVDPAMERWKRHGII